jgi:hypothetical protein
MKKVSLAMACAALWISQLAAADKPAAIAPQVSPSAPIRIVLDGARTTSDCKFQADALKQELKSFHYPPGWTLGIACNEVRWQTLLLKIHPPATDAAFTKLSIRTTVFNGAPFFGSFPATTAL